jgi:SAM-dependent methyltransferase
MKLNLGCSDDHRPGHVNIDLAPPADIIMDLRRPWAIDDSTIEEILAHDVFEHLDNQVWPGQKGIIWAMNEAHRVLKPGGRLDLVVPCLPGIAPWVDPTHVSVWTADLRYYFDERWNHSSGERGRLGPAYGITALFRTIGGRSGPDWTPIQYAKDAPERRKIMVLLEAVK